MLDEYSQHLIEGSELPKPLVGSAARDLISSSYLHWFAQSVLDATEPRVLGGAGDLNRLSLASSILEDGGDVDSAASHFLVAEAADVAQMTQPQGDGDTPLAQFRRGVHLLDIAAYFHLADYDANANFLAKKAIQHLASRDPVAAHLTTETQLAYYLTLAHFLRGKFATVEGLAARSVQAETAEDRAFAFLTRYLGNLAKAYSAEQALAPETRERISNLSKVLQERNPSYFALRAETERLLSFASATSHKALYPLLAQVFHDQQAYLHDRITGENDEGYPFAWPPVREFCVRYFQENSRHAIINVPTGAGKSFLAELAAVRALRDGWVLYMAPTNALCAQIRRDLALRLRSLGDIGVEWLLGYQEYTPELPEFAVRGNILVVTPEKALLFLKLDPDRFKTCSLAVLDECHILGESQRGEFAEGVLAFCMAQNPNLRIVLMSALIENTGELAEWLLKRTGQGVAQISVPWRPTRTARLAVLPDWSSLAQIKRGRGTVERYAVRAFADVVTPWRADTTLVDWRTSIGWERKPSTVDWVNNVSCRLAEKLAEKNLLSLVFVIKSRHHAFSMGDDFSARLPNRDPISQEEQDLYTLAEYELGTKSVVKELVEDRGIAVHTSEMLDCERRASELAFEKRRVHSMVATGTLSQGLNLAAEAVIIAGTKFSEYDSEADPDELRQKALKQVLNGTGRAARANTACRGVSFIVPDAPDTVSRNANKPELMTSVGVLAMKEASFRVQPPMARLLDGVDVEHQDHEPNDAESALFARMPVAPEAFGASVRNVLGASTIDSGRLDRIIGRLEAIRASALAAGHTEWELQAASLAGVRFPIAANLRAYVNTCQQRSDFTPPDDSYTGWGIFLLGWLRGVPAVHTWDLLQSHLKSWRWYWPEKDPDLLGTLRLHGYPSTTTPELDEQVALLWDNIEQTTLRWLNGDPYLTIAQSLVRRTPAKGTEFRRTNPGHFIPRALKWGRVFVLKLSLFAGLLAAMRDTWVQNESETVPNWLSGANTLRTLSLGLRAGVTDPSALAWYRYEIPERRAASLLRSSVPIALSDAGDAQASRDYIRRAKEYLRTQPVNPDSPIVAALYRHLHLTQS